MYVGTAVTPSMAIAIGHPRVRVIADRWAAHLRGCPITTETEDHLYQVRLMDLSKRLDVGIVNKWNEALLSKALHATDLHTGTGRGRL